MSLTKRVLSMVLIGLGVLCAALGLAQQAGMKTLQIALQAEIRFAAPWQPSEVEYSNAQELIVRQKEPGAEAVAAATAAAPVGRIFITTEARTDQADALRRLEAIAASRNAPAEFVEVGGWAAVEIKFTEQLPRRGAKGDEEGGPMPEQRVQRTITAIAQDDKVVVMDASVLPDAPTDLQSSAQKIMRGVKFERSAAPAMLQQALEGLRKEEKERRIKVEQLRVNPAASPTEAALPGEATGGAPATPEVTPAPDRATDEGNGPDGNSLGAATRVQGGQGELEIAAVRMLRTSSSPVTPGSPSPRIGVRLSRLGRRASLA